MQAGFPDTMRRYARAALRRARDRLALQGYAALVHGPLQELVERVDALRVDLERAERARMPLQDQLSVGAARVELLLEEVAALRADALVVSGVGDAAVVVDATGDDTVVHELLEGHEIERVLIVARPRP